MLGLTAHIQQSRIITQIYEIKLSYSKSLHKVVRCWASLFTFGVQICGGVGSTLRKPKYSIRGGLKSTLKKSSYSLMYNIQLSGGQMSLHRKLKYSPRTDGTPSRNCYLKLRDAGPHCSHLAFKYVGGYLWFQ
ncbi:uncharacterized protein LACBIDRAFT_335917 [Laccaria bicolor S238N-H82]|uniref:Predicted protein n=1 Tax=Laccaria bicolor (strain S238N-H82 / ATCC MYA-4686) TaxID=486041 RepID=B0E3U0_LACBS|nr:uncharacterized protein LACBIDRAFT_335917 [Laccaria bicolor S238N-H82]EDQ98487.1 predicted protein [Laccaria bicolor S238N-H82]|eukprot:XP_001890860.1 predicted protein [Laccaria bicolor S238N-H82]